MTSMYECPFCGNNDNHKCVHSGYNSDDEHFTHHVCNSCGKEYTVIFEATHYEDKNCEFIKDYED